jgi:hypothetical protein
MTVNLLLSAVSVAIALALWPRVEFLSAAFGVLACWEVFCAFTADRQPAAIPRLGGYARDACGFCRGCLITGQVDSGEAWRRQSQPYIRHAFPPWGKPRPPARMSE